MRYIVHRVAAHRNLQRQQCPLDCSAVDPPNDLEPARGFNLDTAGTCSRRVHLALTMNCARGASTILGPAKTVSLRDPSTPKPRKEKRAHPEQNPKRHGNNGTLTLSSQLLGKQWEALAPNLHLTHVRRYVHTMPLEKTNNSDMCPTRWQVTKQRAPATVPVS